MRRRLAVSYGLLLVAVLLALAVPLAVTSLRRNSERIAADRLADAVYLASVAEPALRTGQSRTLLATLRRYGELYGISADVVDMDGRVVTALEALGEPSGTEPGTVVAFTAHQAGASVLGRADISAAMRRALAGGQVGGDTRIWPWDDSSLVVAVPVSSNGEVIGAVVTVSPTGRLRSATVREWLMWSAAGLVVLAGCALMAAGLARWTLRPVSALDAAAQTLAAGEYAVRVPADSGPAELRGLGSAFNHMAERVSDVMVRQQAFVAQASHQLRNPLTTLLLRLEALEEEALTEQGRSEHRFAVEEVDRLRRMIEALLILARSECGGDRVETVDAVAVAAARVRDWQPVARARDVTVRLDAPPGAVPVCSVPTGLEQTLDTLLDNAVKFGARTVTVLVTGGARPRVTVADDGPGLNAEQLSRANERFWRAASVQNIDGHGLGLSIATTLTEAAGGTLRLGAAEDGGLAVTLDLATP
ncbi:ATP-binding protein [Actinoplanes sp. NPDC020271]|uniref:HAMP domain-containing sensor histidine kinase n=1 Tax=Actinoplanes sp. NPDC020271 TaxID=3363896 RepID=UPI0037A5E5D4